MFLKSWRLIDTGVSSASYNMAVDEALLSNFNIGNIPILRLYRWEPSLSLGRFSDLNKTLHEKRLYKKDLQYVRRISGGGVLVHGGDLSYSLILPREILKDTGVKESYRYLCKFLIQLYKKLDLNAKFAHELNLESSKSDICMASNEPYDITINGKKMGGNAQRYTTKALFQHGSIPISLDVSIFRDIFVEEYNLNIITTLDKIGKDITYLQLSKLLIESFSESFKVELVNDTLSQVEQKSVDELIKHKYSQRRWNIDAKYDKT